MSFVTRRFVFLRRLLLAMIVCGMVTSAAPPPAKALSLCILLCGCTINTSPEITLTDYNPLNGNPSMGTGTFTIGCSLLAAIGAVLVPYTVTLNTGGSGSFVTRKMTGPSSATLNYNLYSDPGLGTIWGDGGGATHFLSTSIQVSVLNLVVNDIQTVYASVPGGQNVRWGKYTDTVTATLTF